MVTLSKMVAIAISMTILAACSTELFEQSYAPYPSEFDSNNGVVTIFRESHFVGMRADAYITVGSRPFGYISNGSGIQIGLPPGKSIIDVHTSLDPSKLSIPIEIEPGKSYYIELAAQAPSMYMLGAVPYLLGNLKSNVNQYCNAGWCAAIEDKAVAQPKIEKITLLERVRKSSF